MVEPCQQPLHHSRITRNTNAPARIQGPMRADPSWRPLKNGVPPSSEHCGSRSYSFESHQRPQSVYRHRNLNQLRSARCSQQETIYHLRKPPNACSAKMLFFCKFEVPLESFLRPTLLFGIGYSLTAPLSKKRYHGPRAIALAI